MFADFSPSTDSNIEIRDHAVKDHQFFRYKAEPDLVIKPDQNRLDPEPGRTPAVHSTGPLIAEQTT
jgi:hypothetical protein